MVKTINSVEAVLSLLIGFFGRGYIISGVIWFFIAAGQTERYDWIESINPIAGTLPGLGLLVIGFLLSFIKEKIRLKVTRAKSGTKVVSMIFGMEMKTESFSIQAFLLLLIASFDIALGVSIGTSSKWPISLVVMACVSFLGIMLNKHSGNRTANSGAESIKRTGTAVLGIGFTCIASVLLLEPVSKMLKWVAKGAFSVIKAGFLALKKFFELLGSLIRPGKIAETPFEYPIEEFNIPEIEYRESSEIARIIVIGITVLILIYIVIQVTVLLVRYLIKLSMRKRKGQVVGTAIEIQNIEFRNIFQRIRLYFIEKYRKIKAKWMLFNHPTSFGRVLTKLEKRMRKHSGLRRREGETVREFIDKLKARYKGENSNIFDEFLDAFDKAIYGPNKSWLAEYPNAKEFLKEVSKNI